MRFLNHLVIMAFLLLAGCSGNSSREKQSSADSLVIENIFPFQSQHCHGSSITELPGGDLLTVWFQGSGERTADDVSINGSRFSKRQGKWSPPFEMADVDGFPDINPVVFVDPQSRLWLVWYTVIAYQWESSILKYRISEDYKKPGPPVWKWQDMIHVKPDGNASDGIGRNDEYVKTLTRKYDEYYQYLVSSGSIKDDGSSPISNALWETAKSHYLDIARGTNLMASGTDNDEKGERVKTRLGYPLMRRIGWQSRNKPLFIGNRMLLPLYSDGFDHSLIAISDDLGDTWNFSEPIVGAGNVQPTLALNKDGSITAYMRDNGPPPQRLMMSVSKDSGKTWSTVNDSEIPNPGTAADIVVLESGNWIMVHNDIEQGRHQLSVWLSEDEGKTWPFRKTLVKGIPGSMTRAHYPAIIQGSDGVVHVSFTNQVASEDGKSEVKNIAHARFSEQWLKK
ncbi:MAG TPA: exo-alpha-sialidase [Bacteroidales bacterium]|nr:exo-alpha-sialidase [Bacteroidales bacterium]